MCASSPALVFLSVCACELPTGMAAYAAGVHTSLQHNWHKLLQMSSGRLVCDLAAPVWASAHIVQGAAASCSVSIVRSTAWQSNSVRPALAVSTLLEACFERSCLPSDGNLRVTPAKQAGIQAALAAPCPAQPLSLSLSARSQGAATYANVDSGLKSTKKVCAVSCWALHSQIKLVPSTAGPRGGEAPSHASLEPSSNPC